MQEYASKAQRMWTLCSLDGVKHLWSGGEVQEVRMFRKYLCGTIQYRVVAAGHLFSACRAWYSLAGLVQLM